MPQAELAPDQAILKPATEPPLNGPAVAALMAAAVACATLGLMVTLCELSPIHAQAWLTVYAPAGPLSGKALAATLAYFLSWGTLGCVWRRRNLPLGRWLAVAGLLFIAGLLLTFPPIYEILAARP